MEFLDRLLTCNDCRGEFIFTAGEQLFFFDKQFKNDPKRCKPCKCKRTALGTSSGPAAAGISRTETRTDCSECGVETTVPFKPTQGRPVLCRMCFQKLKPIIPTLPSPVPELSLTPASLLAAQAAAAADLPIPALTLEAPADLQSGALAREDRLSRNVLAALPCVEAQQPVDALMSADLAQA